MNSFLARRLYSLYDKTYQPNESGGGTDSDMRGNTDSGEYDTIIDRFG